MIPNHARVLEAIAERKKLKIKFYSLSDSGVIERICAPLDYGPGASPEDGLNRYWVWDYANPPGSQTLGLNPDQIVDLHALSEEFQPGDFGALPWPWAVERDWSRPARPQPTVEPSEKSRS